MVPLCSANKPLLQMSKSELLFYNALLSLPFALLIAIVTKDVTKVKMVFAMRLSQSVSSAGLQLRHVDTTKVLSLLLSLFLHGVCSVEKVY